MENHAWDGYIGATLGGILGAIIAGVATFAAIRTQLKAERELRRQEADDKQKAMLSSIYHELDSYWKEYQRRGGEALENCPEDSAYNNVVSVPPNIFVIYDAEARYVGTLADFSLRNKIISTYLAIKILRESFGYHNRNIFESIIASQHSDAVQTPEAAKFAEVKLLTQKQSATGLRRSHLLAKHAIDELLPLLRKYADPSQTTV